MEINTVLPELAEIYGPSGREARVAEKLSSLLREKGLETETDALGNVWGRLGDAGKKIVFAAHMDSIGLMLCRIDKDGYGYVTAVGGVSAQAIAHAEVLFQNGVRALVCVRDDKSGKELKVSDLYLDFGTRSREETEEKVSVGDIAVYAHRYQRLGGRIAGTYLDDRAGCAVLLSAIDRVKAPKNQVYFLFTTQEETGASGAGPACYGIDGAIGIAVDVTAVDDIPGSNHDGTAVLGKGAAIKILDRSAMSSTAVIQWMTETAKARNIPHQKDILTIGGTDAGAMAGVRKGMNVGGISIPCRYTHSPLELIDGEDLEACAELIAALAETEL